MGCAAPPRIVLPLWGETLNPLPVARSHSSPPQSPIYTFAMLAPVAHLGNITDKLLPKTSHPRWVATKLPLDCDYLNCDAFSKAVRSLSWCPVKSKAGMWYNVIPHDTFTDISSRATKMQVRLALLSNAGGSGKTTLATHLAYLLGAKGFSVALIDLDPQGSISLFCGLERPKSDQTIAAVLQDDFQGNWPLVSLWQERLEKVEACQGEMGLVRTINELVLHERGAYLLGDRLTDHPLPHNLVIFDCPATLGPLPLIAVSASTHLIIPVQVEPKSADGAGKLLEWLYYTERRLRLKPEPQIIGFIPSQYDRTIAIHRNILTQLVPQLSKLKIHCFKPIRFSTEFKNASSKGLPLHLYRPKHPACADFEPIVVQLTELLKREA